MVSLSKLKPNEKMFLLAVILLIALVAIILASKNFGPISAVAIWGALVFINAPISLGEFLHTRNIGLFVVFLFQITAATFAAIVVIHGFNLARSVSYSFILLLSFLGLLGMYFIFTRQSKWRYREVLELAAQPVDEAQNGYTDRPKPIGQFHGVHNDVARFSRFLLNHLVAIPYIESDRIVLSLGMTLGHRIGLRKSYHDYSHIIFKNDGNVAVHISKNDYLKYKAQLTFDQLCESMGRLFLNFYELYKDGQGERILDQLNELKLSPFADFGESSI